MKNMNKFTQWNNGSVDVMIMCVITHQKHIAQYGRSAWSGLHIFNTLCIFTKEPNKELEIKLEWMNFICIICWLFSPIAKRS